MTAEPWARRRIEELRERIAELSGLLEVAEDRLSRLVISREAVQEVLGGTARPVGKPVVRGGLRDPSRRRATAA